VQKGVFKVSRPDIETLLEEELAALDRMAEFFDDYRHLYPLGDFRYKELFGDVKAALLKELDFRNEQENLALARRFYRKNKRIHVPQLAPFSSRHFTAMTRIEGGKVTDVIDSRKGRKQAADSIFRAIICAPLFSAEASPVFHGDPHAGNIYCKGLASDGEPAIALLDWSQTGRLERGWRINLLKLIQGTMLGSTVTICRAVAALSPDASQDGAEIDIAGAVKTVMAMEEYRKASLVKKTFVLLERLSFQGVRFHGDLLLFRKSFFTLDGLMHDLDREFNMDLALMAYIRDLIVDELPRRIAVLLAPISDAPEKYRSLLSNRDLQMLLLCQASEFVKKNAHKVRDFMERYAGMVDSLFSLPKFFSSRTAKVLLGLYFMYRMRDSVAET
jgi:ubiquinone biosynthesis protein